MTKLANECCAKLTTLRVTWVYARPFVLQKIDEGLRTSGVCIAPVVFPTTSLFKQKQTLVN